MNKKRGKSGAIKVRKPINEQVCSPARKRSTKHEDAINAAVKEGMRRFLESNRENIRKSSKEQIASASYCGGMIDMITLIRSALGRWAVEELLVELEEWNKAPAAGDRSQVKIRVEPSELGGLSEKDAKELGDQIAKWIQERTTKGTGQAKDPMFA